MRTDALLSKRDHVRAQIAALEGQDRVVMRLGGRAGETRPAELAFQQQRLAWIDELLSMEGPAVADRLAELRASLGAEVEALETGDVRGLTPGDVALVCHAKLCQIALGQHRAQTGARS